MGFREYYKGVKDQIAQLKDGISKRNETIFTLKDAVLSAKRMIEELEEMNREALGGITDREKWMDAVANHVEDAEEIENEPEDPMVEWYRKNNPNAKVGKI